MKKTLPSSTLTVPNDLSYLPAIQSYAAEVTKAAGFPELEVVKILLALEEAVVNVVEHAFDPSEQATYQVVFEPMSSGIRIVIKEKGLPFTPDSIPEYTAPTDIDETSTRGLGSFLMKKSVDEAALVNLGREGKELHLVKYLPYKSIIDLQDASDLELYPKPKKEDQPKEKKEFRIRLMKLSECLEVSRLFYRAYGYSYGIDSIYYPDKFEQLHMDGLIVSVVSVVDDDRIVGHVALVRDRLDQKIAEAAMAVVHPDFRGQGFQNTMISALIEEGRKVGLKGIFSKAVTNHPYAQKAGLKAGFRRCALGVGFIPTDRSFKGIHAELSQRESVLYGFLPIENPPGIRAYPPEQHKAFIERVYGFIGLDRSFEETQGNHEDGQEESSSIKTTIVPSYNRAVIEVHRYGRNVVSEVKQVLKELRFKKIEQISFYLNLEDPLTAVYCGEFEKLGFFVAGILPFYHEGDALILQYLNNVSIDYSRIHAVSDQADQILSYVREHDPNIR
ncbi:MAG: Serine-protein kinase RsbW [Syntrophorhabdaceae bacterium PtaU1.Bin034]|nr:MAG: Serine-protein kinase RsbW [Syntrophorhabdaceae bacterium PtaU1.Bin034]